MLLPSGLGVAAIAVGGSGGRGVDGSIEGAGEGAANSSARMRGHCGLAKKFGLVFRRLEYAFESR